MTKEVTQATKSTQEKKREKDMRRHTDPGGICAGAGMAEEGFR